MTERNEKPVLTTYTVRLDAYQFAGVTVEAATPEEAIDLVLDEGIPEICAQCSGWGQNWSRECDDNEWNAHSVTTADGNEEWVRPTGTEEAVIRELKQLLDGNSTRIVKRIHARIEELQTGKM